MKILKTDNGLHSPEKWAVATAETIFDISEIKLDDNKLIPAKKLQALIAEVLVPHHNKVQTTERENLRADRSHVLTPYSAKNYVDDAINEIIALSINSPWQIHFSKSDVQAAVKQVITEHMITSQHIERLWHADQNPDNEIAQQYKLRFHTV